MFNTIKYKIDDAYYSRSIRKQSNNVHKKISNDSGLKLYGMMTLKMFVLVLI